MRFEASPILCPVLKDQVTLLSQQTAKASVLASGPPPVDKWPCHSATLTWPLDIVKALDLATGQCQSPRPGELHLHNYDVGEEYIFQLGV